MTGVLLFLLTIDSQFDLWIVTHESWIRSDRHLPNDPQPYSLEASRETLSMNTEKASSWDFSTANKVQNTYLRTVLTLAATLTHR